MDTGSSWGSRTWGDGEVPSGGFGHRVGGGRSKMAYRVVDPGCGACCRPPGALDADASQVAPSAGRGFQSIVKPGTGWQPNGG